MMFVGAQLENSNMDQNQLNACASKMGQHVGALLNCARLAAAGADGASSSSLSSLIQHHNEGDPALLESARLLAEAVAKMLKNVIGGVVLSMSL